MDKTSPPAVKRTLRCDHCGEEFPSRNQLFGHLTTSCSSQSGLAPPVETEKVTLLFGYDGNQVSRVAIEKTLLAALDAVRKHPESTKPEKSYTEIGRAQNQSSVSSYEGRTSSMYQQDEGTSAIADVLCYTGDVLQSGQNEDNFVDEINAVLPPHVQVFTRTSMPISFHAVI